MPNPDALFEAAAQAFRAELATAVQAVHDARNPREFTDAERELGRLSREFADDMVRRALQSASDDPERVRDAMSIVGGKAATRGISVRSVGRRPTKVRLLGGNLVDLVTPYASAKPRGGKSCKQRGKQGTGVYPVLDQLGILGRSTPALRLLVSRAMCEANSISAGRELLEAGGVTLDHKAALRLTYEVCDDGLRARKGAIRSTQRGQSGVLSGRRVVAAVDGGRLQVRVPTAGRPRRGGRRHFMTEWREPKILTIYVLGEDGRRDRKVPSIIDGTLGDADAVFELLRYYLRRNGGHDATHLTLIGDAAEWIWNRGEQLRKDLGVPSERYSEIVDYFHAAERLSDLSKSTQAKWGEEIRLGWLHEQKRRLKAGDIEAIERVVQIIGTRKDTDMSTEADYWGRHRERMRYAHFRSLGLAIGSGAVESSVRRVINLRLKGASVAWLEEHAEGMLHLRAHAKSGRWSDLEDAVLQTTGWRPSARQPRHAA